MTIAYRKPNLDAFSPLVTRDDLMRAGSLLRYAQTPEGKPSDYLIAHVANICASRGRDEAIMWLDGYWYATGVRKHTIITAIQTILSIDVEA